MNQAISQLVQFGLDHGLLQEADVDYSVNLLLNLLKLAAFEKQETKADSLYPILDTMLAYAVEKGLCEDTPDCRDLFDTRIMNCLMPRPSEVNARFAKLYAQSPQAATDWFYDLSIHSNYIRKSRTDTNIQFEQEGKYGPLQITINLSKPEKDPKDIARARLLPSSGYPACLLCKENVGYAGNLNHPARQTHRIIPLSLKGKPYYLQYSPYVYYNEHCILLNEKHVPMHIDRQTFENLLDFVRQFPHYMAGSNTDIPIVGGSILSHDHYQGGRHHFPMEDARILNTYQKDGVEIQMLFWPLSTLRLVHEDPAKLVDLADTILQAWTSWEDPERDILKETDGIRHNAITPIARFKDGKYQLDLVLRNNRTSEQYPDGIFHPHPEHHHIKKENIGLIEVMGLAVLPARLKEELVLIRQVLLEQTKLEEHLCLLQHADWVAELKTRLPDLTNVPEEQKEDILQAFLEKETAMKFEKVLENAGVYKMDEDGIQGLDAFVRSVL